MNQVQARIKNLQKKLCRKKIDGLLVSEPYNRRYLSGYCGEDHGIGESSGFLLIPARGRPYLLTDSRFNLQAAGEAPDYTILIYPKGLNNRLKQLLPELGIRRLGFESHYTLHATVVQREKVFAKTGINLVPVTDLVETMRLIKSEDEIKDIGLSVERNEQVFESVYASIEPGMSERELALALELTMHEMGAEKPSFSTIVAFAGNGAHPHAVPGERILKSGDIVLIDMGLILNGYCSDMTKTFVAGKPDSIFSERLKLVRRAQLAGVDAIRDGVTSREVDRAARKVIEEGGYGKYFTHSLGHGVGLAVHEEPRLSSRSRRKLKKGMVVTVEPGIYLPDWGGIRLENMVVVREDGAEVLNRNMTGLDL
jgi:Xaa-Pro aminopeptidase